MVAACVVLLSVSYPILLNDGWIGFSGAPKLDGKHPTIRMVDEVIRIRVGMNRMWADCRFTFKNEGPACRARIGFPDFDTDDYIDPKSGIRSIYTTFNSNVDGRQAKTHLLAGESGTAWQVKTVAFGAGQVRRIQNIYSLALGILSMSGKSIQGREPRTNQLEYILSTGRTWKGAIGLTRVEITFDSDARAAFPLKATPFPDERNEDPQSVALRAGGVYWAGPSKPIITRNRMVFVRRNWIPKDDDNILLRFGVFPRPRSWDGVPE